MSDLKVTEIRLFRPYPDEIPWELLADTGIDDGTLASLLETNLLRVGKHAGRLLGAYGISPRTATTYALVTLIVVAEYRRRGVGRWLLGHAIGLAESKGAREIVTAVPPPGAAGSSAGERFLLGQGFEPADGELRLTLTPE